MKAIRHGLAIRVFLLGALALLAGSLVAACAEETAEDEGAAQSAGANGGDAGAEGDAGAAAAADAVTASVTIRWWGQSCFTITSDGEAEQSVLIDPFGEMGFGYAFPDLEPQVCLVSHDHSDHNAVDRVVGDPVVIREAGEHQAAGMTFTGIATFHDDQQGAARGDNLVFVWEMAGIRLCHLGDLGHLLSEEQVAAIGQVDVLMAPVGGVFTIDATRAVEVAGQLSAKVFFPMHYRTDATPSLPLATVDDFLQSVPAEWSVQQPGESSVTLNAAELPANGTEVIVLGYQ